MALFKFKAEGSDSETNRLKTAQNGYRNIECNQHIIGDCILNFYSTLSVIKKMNCVDFIISLDLVRYFYTFESTVEICECYYFLCSALLLLVIVSVVREYAMMLWTIESTNVLDNNDS